MPDVQAQVQATLDELTRTGAEQGIQVAAYFDGALVVDAWSGLADQPMETRCCKSVVVTGIHLLAERGRKRCHQLRTVGHPARGRLSLTL